MTNPRNMPAEPAASGSAATPGGGPATQAATVTAYAPPALMALGSTMNLLQGKLVNASYRDAGCQWYYQSQPGC